MFRRVTLLLLVGSLAYPTLARAAGDQPQSAVSENPPSADYYSSSTESSETGDQSFDAFPVDFATGTNAESTLDSSAYQTGVSNYSGSNYNYAPYSGSTTSTGAYFSTGSGVDNSIQSLTGLGNTNTFGYSQSTSITGTYPSTGHVNRCGVSVYGNVNNANTGLERVYSTGVVWNSQKCADEEKLRELEQEVDKLNIETNLQISKLRTQEAIINQCLRERGQATRAGQNPDAVCTVPDLRQMTSILD